MLRISSSIRALVLGASFFVVACSDLPTAPESELELIQQVAPAPGLLGGVVGVLGRTVETTVTTVVEVADALLSPVLTRDNPLRRDELVSQWIGRDGGVIRLPRAGLTVVVPRGALDRFTRITVRAPAGDLMGYEFGPHGLQFNRPVTLRQEVTRNEVSGGLEGIYFDGDLLPEVQVLEVFPTLTGRGEAVFRIDHFSGYAFRRGGYVIATN